MSQRTSKGVCTCHTTVYQSRGKSYQRLTLLINKQYKIEHLHTENYRVLKADSKYNSIADSVKIKTISMRFNFHQEN